MVLCVLQGWLYDWAVAVLPESVEGHLSMKAMLPVGKKARQRLANKQ